jgi:hypothetical protein
MGEHMEPQRARRNTPCSKKSRQKGRDMGRWKIDSWIEDEVIFEMKGLKPLEDTERRE